MPQFAYQAVTSSGRAANGVIDADSVDEAGGLLLGRGLTPTESHRKHQWVSIPSLGQLRARLGFVKPRELILFTKQFSTMLRAGMPMMRLLQVLEQQTENVKLQQVVHDILDRVQRGETLHDSFSQHEDVFSPLYSSMINAGEASGSLPEVLERLMYILEHEHKIRSDVKAACRYPIIVVLMLVAAFFVMLMFVIPRFAKIFEQSDIALPMPTQVCVTLYSLMSSYWPLLIVAAGGIWAGIHYGVRYPQGRYIRDLIFLRMPILGPLFQKSAMSRFASIFAILQSSGVGVLDALMILRETIGNEAIGREFDKITDQLVEGRGIAAPLRSARFFPPMVVNMTAIGEESGALDEMLREVASHYDIEVEFATKGLSDALTPILTIGLAAVVGFFALAVFLPMWDMYKIVK